MKHHLWLLSLACGLSLTNVALGNSGSATLRPANGNFIDFIYVLNLPLGMNDRAITRYNQEGVAFPNGSEFDPNTVVCGARTAVAHQSNVAGPRTERVDVRLEDPLNPGFPEADLAPSGALALVCGGASSVDTVEGAAGSFDVPQFLAFHNWTFNAGAGFNDPLCAFYLTYKFVDPVLTPADPGYMGLDVTAPDNTRCKFRDSVAATYGQLGNNHFLELYAFTPFILDLTILISGASRVVGETGRKFWYYRGSRRDNRCVDDFITLSLVLDNGTGLPITSQVLSVVAQATAIGFPTPRDVTNLFRVIRYSDALTTTSPNKTLTGTWTWQPIRTVIIARIPITVNLSTKLLDNNFPAILPFVVRAQPTTFPTPAGPRDDETDDLGLSEQRGQNRDRTGEFILFAQNPTITNDTVSVRYPLVHLLPQCNFDNNNGTPNTTASTLTIANAVVFAANQGGSGGFDAVRLQRADDVIPNAADQTPQGILAGVGIVDNTASVPVVVDPNNPCTQTLVTLPALVNQNSDIWVVTYSVAGDTPGAGTFVCGDSSPRTVLGESFSSQAGVQPYTPYSTLNAMIDLNFVANPFVGPTDPSVPATVTSDRPLIPRGQVPTKRVLFSRN